MAEIKRTVRKKRRKKVSLEDQIHIQEMYRDTKINIPQLGRMFKVSPTTINTIIEKKY